MSESWKILKTSVLTLNKGFLKTLGEIKLQLLIVLNIIFNYCIVKSEYANIEKLIFIISGNILVFVGIRLYNTYKNIKGKSKDIPMLNKRYTHKENDVVYIESKDWTDAVLYLSMIEDYFEEKGYYN